ncbi:uncharacterized protein [Hyperolius riggenbachi]|uniref:uncharacterized protein n=1 Tax=Hyperolius riggenbachi TaxID=752182 RepID=UPI0035A26B09
MAEFWSPGDMQNVKLTEFLSSRGGKGHHVKGKHLSMEEAFNILSDNERNLNESGRIFFDTLRKMKPHSFKWVQHGFPVHGLQHVTNGSSVGDIYEEECFKITKQPCRPGFKDLLFWSAAVPSEDIETAREKSYEKVSKVLKPWQAKKYKDRIKEQYANSPAFNEFASRYGNFKFSFSLFHLLSLYQSQHCGGREPQLRILGTDMYKQEIAHYILVHSPNKNYQFRDLPIVPTIQGNSQPLPFVYWRDKTLYWRPESTSSVLTVKISDKGMARRDCPLPCNYFIKKGYCRDIKEENYKVWSAWNHLVFAFHLPHKPHLEISRGELLKSLTTCEIDEAALIDESEHLDLEEAEEVIHRLKKDFNRRKRMRTSHLLN